MGSLDGQGGSADTRGTASWDGLMEPLLESDLDLSRLIVDGVVTAGVMAVTIMAVIVGGLCLIRTGLCLARGDLLSLRPEIGEDEDWCRRFPGRITGVVACVIVLVSLSTGLC